MKSYSRLSKQLAQNSIGADVALQSKCYGSTVTESVDGRVFVDGSATDYGSLEEAKAHIRQQHTQKTIYEQIQQELYEEMSDTRIAAIIKQYHDDIRITDKLIESYVELASSNLFSVDPVAQDIRSLIVLDPVATGYVSFKLEDGTSIAITEATQHRLNNMFGQHVDVVNYMRESRNNFLDVLNQVEE